MAGQQVECPTCNRVVSIPDNLGGEMPIGHAPPVQAETLQFHCPLCSGIFQVAAEMAGQQVACPHCNGHVTLPGFEGPLPPPPFPGLSDLPPPVKSRPTFDFPPQAEPPSAAPAETPLPEFNVSPSPKPRAGSGGSKAAAGRRPPTKTAIETPLPSPRQSRPTTSESRDSDADRFPPTAPSPPGAHQPASRTAASTDRPGEAEPKVPTQSTSGTGARASGSSSAADQLLPPGATSSMDESMLPPGASSSAGDFPSPHHSSAADALLPPGAVAAGSTAAPSGPYIETSKPEKQRKKEDAEPIVIPTEGGYVPLHEPVKTVGTGTRARELHRLSPEEKQKKRLVKNIIMAVVGVLVLLISLAVLLYTRG